MCTVIWHQLIGETDECRQPKNSGWALVFFQKCGGLIIRKPGVKCFILFFTSERILNSVVYWFGLIETDDWSKHNSQSWWGWMVGYDFLDWMNEDWELRVGDWRTLVDGYRWWWLFDIVCWIDRSIWFWLDVTWA